jgi:hypothetical protein
LYLQINRISGRISIKSIPVPVSDRIPDIKKAGLSGRMYGASLIKTKVMDGDPDSMGFVEGTRKRRK